jgi:uncharacterized protein (DUF924 family)
VDQSSWYNSSDALDQEIRDRFLETWQQIMQGGHSMWLTYPSGALAYILVTDQFTRNMFRGSGQAFASDQLALTVAKQCVTQKWDLRIGAPARQFFYLPLMHSENLYDQDRCIRLMKDRMPQTGENNLLHARVHREVIRQFGRFPYRNDALGRAYTALEREYLDNGGYGMTLRQLDKAS